MESMLATVGFVSIRCEDRTLQIRLSGGTEERIQGWGAGPMHEQRFTRENLLTTPVGGNGTYTGLMFWFTRKMLCGS